MRSFRSCALACFVFAAACLASGCDAGRDESGRIDVQWHRKDLVDNLLPHWLEAAPTESGFMRTAFDRSCHEKLHGPENQRPRGLPVLRRLRGQRSCQTVKLCAPWP